MAKWSPVKESKRHEHIKPAYKGRVLMGNKGEDGLKGNTDNKGGSKHANPQHPSLAHKSKSANQGSSPWRKK